MITYKLVGYEHPICGPTCPKGIDKNMRVFWNTRSLDFSHGAVLAYDGKKLVGFFRYNVYGNELAAYGTYVLRDYRMKGVAYKLWRKALRHVNPLEVTVYTTSPGGRKLTRALRSKFPEYNWEINDLK